MILNKLKRLCDYAGNKELFIVRTKGLPMEFVEELLEIKKFLPRIDKIFDIGAYDGEFTIAANYVWGSAEIYSFETMVYS